MATDNPVDAKNIIVNYQVGVTYTSQSSYVEIEFY